jgi:hypothetical protein
VPDISSADLRNVARYIVRSKQISALREHIEEFFQLKYGSVDPDQDPVNMVARFFSENERLLDAMKHLASYPLPVLEDLAHEIVRSPHTEGEQSHIEDFLLRRYGASSPTIDPIDGVLRFFSESTNLLKAVTFLVDSRRTLVVLANALGHDEDSEYCDLDAQHDEAAAKVLEALEIGNIEWLPEYEEWGARRDRRLEERAREFDEHQGRADEQNLMRYASTAWPYLETLLRGSIHFYSELFGYDDESAVTRAFSHARSQHSLNPMFDAIQGIENAFAQDEDKRKLCTWHFDRPSPFHGFLEGEIEVIPNVWPTAWIGKAARFDPRISEVPLDDPFRMSRLNKYKTEIDYCRNFYAHRGERVVWNAGVEEAKYSFQVAQGLIHRFDTELHLSPVLIVLIQKGFDAYGRRVVRFVRDRDIKDDGVFSRDKVRYLFARKEEEVELHTFYLCAYPAFSGMFEPVMYPVRKVLPAERRTSAPTLLL